MKKSFTLLCLLFAILGNTLADETNAVGGLSAGPWKLLKDAPSKAKITFQAHDSLQTAVQFSLTLPDMNGHK